MTVSVLMLCSYFYPEIGGAERQAEKLGRALLKQGCRVEILTPRRSLELPETEDLSGLIVHRFPLLDVVRHMPAAVLPNKLYVPGAVNLVLLKICLRRALRVHLPRFDILHAHMASEMSAFAASAAIRMGVPCICKVGSAGHKSDFVSMRRKPVVGQWLIKGMRNEVARWIATTPAVQDTLAQERIPAERVALIPNGVEIPKVQLKRRPVRKFLYLGRLATTAERDVPTMLKAFDRLADQRGDVQLAVVGHGNLLASTKAMVSDMRHAHLVQVPGLQPPQSWYEWADAFVLPSRYEGLSNALLEAMSYALPCIANDIPPNRQVLEDGKVGLLTPVGDEDALLACMQQLAESEALAAQLGELGLRRAQQVYSVDAISAKYVALYENLKRGAPTRVKEDLGTAS